MSEEINRVIQWNSLMGVQPSHNEGNLKLGASLVKEEVEELLEEIFKPSGELKGFIDLPNASKEVADLLFVTIGLAYRLGIDPIKALSRVNDSNYSKFCTTPDEAVDSVSHYNNHKGIPCYIDWLDEGTFAVKRIDNDKVVKPITYKEADMSGTYCIPKDNLSTVQGQGADNV